MAINKNLLGKWLLAAAFLTVAPHYYLRLEVEQEIHRKNLPSSDATPLRRQVENPTIWGAGAVIGTSSAPAFVTGVEMILLRLRRKPLQAKPG